MTESWVGAKRGMVIDQQNSPGLHGCDDSRVQRVKQACTPPRPNRRGVLVHVQYFI